MGTKKKNSPGGCGCCGCPVFSDAFDREDDTDLGSDWTEEAGSWEIASNKLQLTAMPGGGADALVLCDSQDGNDFFDEYTGHGTKLSAKLASSSSGDQLGIVFTLGDTADVDFVVLLTVGSSAEIALYVDGDTKGHYCEGITAAAGSEHLLEICAEAYYDYDSDLTPDKDSSNPSLPQHVYSVFFNGALVLSWLDNGGVTSSSASTAPEHRFGFLARTAAGTITFDDLKVLSLSNRDSNTFDVSSPHYDSGNPSAPQADLCPRCVEAPCPIVRGPNSQLRLNIDFWAALSPFNCGGELAEACDLSGLNGTYDLDEVAIDSTAPDLGYGTNFYKVCAQFELAISGTTCGTFDPTTIRARVGRNTSCSNAAYMIAISWTDGSDWVTVLVVLNVIGGGALNVLGLTQMCGEVAGDADATARDTGGSSDNKWTACINALDVPANFSFEFI